MKPRIKNEKDVIAENKLLAIQQNALVSQANVKGLAIPTLADPVRDDVIQTNRRHHCNIEKLEGLLGKPAAFSPPKPPQPPTTAPKPNVPPAGKVLTFAPGAMQKALTECSQGRVGRWEEIRFAGDSRISLLIESGVHGLLDQIRRSGKQPPKIPDCNSIRNAVEARRILQAFVDSGCK